MAEPGHRTAYFVDSADYDYTDTNNIAAEWGLRSKSLGFFAETCGELGRFSEEVPSLELSCFSDTTILSLVHAKL